MWVAIWAADGAAVTRPWPTRNWPVCWYALTIGLVVSPGLEPSQYSCWFSGMNG
jgi:hypothetical protein